MWVSMCLWVGYVLTVLVARKLFQDAAHAHDFEGLEGL